MTSSDRTLRPSWRRGAALVIAAALVVAAGVGCGRSGNGKGAGTAQAKRFPQPIFDGLWLGMTRAAAIREHGIRPTLTAAGRNRRVWAYARPGDYSAELTFAANSDEAPLRRIDVHFGPSDASPDAYIRRFEALLGEPEVRRRKAVVNAYGDQRHDQYDTIWSDRDQYVFFTERSPLEGSARRPVYFLTVKKKEISAAGPPTGYVPPPPPKGKDGKPIEEPIF